MRALFHIRLGSLILSSPLIHLGSLDRASEICMQSRSFGRPPPPPILPLTVPHVYVCMTPSTYRVGQHCTPPESRNAGSPGRSTWLSTATKSSTARWSSLRSSTTGGCASCCTGGTPREAAPYPSRPWWRIPSPMPPRHEPLEIFPGPQ